MTHYKYARYKWCPKCGADRVHRLKDGTTRAAKVGYYLPCGTWLRDLFKNKGLAAELSGYGERPAGHVSKSRGWHEKVTNAINVNTMQHVLAYAHIFNKNTRQHVNIMPGYCHHFHVYIIFFMILSDPQVSSTPWMASDPRNQALIGMSDGIPMFRDKGSRAVTPCALRTANLSDHLSMKFNHIHLAFLYPNEFWTIAAEDDNTFERVPKKPSTHEPLMTVLVDDLLFWEDGQQVVDYSMDPADPRRIFLLHVLLLFWVGDYPGLAEATNFSHQGHHACHWCKIRGDWGFGVNRELYGGYVRYMFLS